MKNTFDVRVNIGNIVTLTQAYAIFSKCKLLVPHGVSEELTNTMYPGVLELVHSELALPDVNLLFLSMFCNNKDYTNFIKYLPCKCVILLTTTNYLSKDITVELELGEHEDLSDIILPICDTFWNDRKNNPDDVFSHFLDDLWIETIYFNKQGDTLTVTISVGS